MTECPYLCAGVGLDEGTQLSCVKVSGGMAIACRQATLVPQRGGGARERGLYLRQGGGMPGLGPGQPEQEGAGGECGGGRRCRGAGAEQHEGDALLQTAQRLLWVLPEEQRRRSSRGSLPPSLALACT